MPLTDWSTLAQNGQMTESKLCWYGKLTGVTYAVLPLNVT